MKTLCALFVLILVPVFVLAEVKTINCSGSDLSRDLQAILEVQNMPGPKVGVKGWVQITFKGSQTKNISVNGFYDRGPGQNYVKLYSNDPGDSFDGKREYTLILNLYDTTARSLSGITARTRTYPLYCTAR